MVSLKKSHFMWKHVFVLIVYFNMVVKVCGDIVLSQVLFRHGDRTPVNPYPADPYKNSSFWPFGWGQLTNIGKEQHYELGSWLRQRYSQLLPSKYSPDDLFVQSTDVDRTLMSVQCNLAALFPPEASQQWHPGLKWQPIPVHTVPEAMDNFLAGKKPCPKYNLEFEKVMTSKEMKHINEKYAKLYSYLSEHTNSTISNIVDIEYIYDTLHIEEINNFTLPDWTKGYYPEKLVHPSMYSFTINAYTLEMKRLKSGLFLGSIITHMAQKINGTLIPNRKMFMYSGHDVTIANLLVSLGVFDLQIPAYASIVLVELHVDESEKYYVQVSYRNSSAHEPYNLSIPGCSSLCPFEKFVELTKHLIPDNWEEECAIHSFTFTHQLFWILLTGCASISALSIIVILICIRQRRASRIYYHKIIEDMS